MKRSFKTSRGFLPGLVLILLLSVALLSTNGFAKYNRTITLEGQVRYAATETETKLADSLELLPVGEQAFLLIPGTTVAPEAVIEISGKTAAAIFARTAGLEDLAFSRARPITFRCRAVR